MNKAGQFTVQYSFTDGGPGGGYCQEGVVPDDGRNLYGTTGYGGNVSDSGWRSGWRSDSGVGGGRD